MERENGSLRLIKIDHFLCPLTLDFMRDPVITKYGHSFDREAIEEWITLHENCPLTRKSLTMDEIYPSITLKSAVEDLLNNNPELRASGSEKNSYMTCMQPVENKGSIKFSEKCKNLGVVEVNVSYLRRKHKLRNLSGDSTYIVFPNPNSFLWMESTGFICAANTGEHPISLISHRIANRGSTEGGEFTLEPTKRQGFDFRGDGWFIEVKNGDASRLLIYEFGTSGGGKGNKLGMHNRS